MRNWGSRWIYQLKSGIALRKAIHSDDPYAVIEQLRVCYEELLYAGLIDEYDFEWYTEDFELYEDFSDYDDATDLVDYELTHFYDLCDNIDVWVSI